MTPRGRTGDPDDDPIEEPAAPICRCDGSGWVQVTARYIDDRAPWPHAPELGAPEEDQRLHDERVEATRLRRAAMENTVYPCRACNPSTFYAWCGGHLDPAHERRDCEFCKEHGLKDARV